MGESHSLDPHCPIPAAAEQMKRGQCEWKCAESVKCALSGVAQLIGVSSFKPKDGGFDSQSGHVPRL